VVDLKGVMVLRHKGMTVRKGAGEKGRGGEREKGRKGERWISETASLLTFNQYFTGVSSKNKGKTVDMLIWCGIKNFYK
jgi:hypothetical protein